MRTIVLGPRSAALHIEAPGCIINIIQVHDADGRRVTRVDVDASGNRYSGEAEWWCADAGQPLGEQGIGIRIVEGIERPVSAVADFG